MSLICMTLITQYHILLTQIISKENRKQVIPVIKENGFTYITWIILRFLGKNNIFRFIMICYAKHYYILLQYSYIFYIWGCFLLGTHHSEPNTPAFIEWHSSLNYHAGLAIDPTSGTAWPSSFLHYRRSFPRDTHKTFRECPRKLGSLWRALD